MKLRFFVCFVAFLCSAWSAHAEKPNIAVSDCPNKIACARGSVVSVLPIWPSKTPRNEEPEGSGVVVADGRLIATADHVIGPASKILVRTISGQVMDAEIVLRDAPTDIALLRISKRLKPFDIAIFYPVGSSACAVGNSFGLNVSVTCGVVSALQMSGIGFNQIEDFIQTDAAVNPGMSGGALVNVDGQLIGMLSAIFTKKSDSNIGVNFAVSAQLLQRVVSDFLDDGSIQRVSSGLIVGPALKTGETGLAGALVMRTKEGSPEAVSGIVPGDIVLFAGKRRIRRAGAYAAGLALLEKGDSLDVEILRDRKRQTVTVRYE